MKRKILFLAANPAGLTARKLDEEAREIQEELRRASHRDRFELEARLAARPLDLLRALREVKPSIVHFVGHAGAEGLHLTSESGQPMQITREALHATFGAAGRTVEIVVLNGCATEELAKLLCELVPVCVGTPSPIGDEAARAFSVGFYGALASSEPAARARLHGQAAMQLVAAGGHALTLLHHRRDIDPEAFVFSDDATELASPRALELAAVFESYRKRKSGSFERWDLRTAGPTSTTGHRPTEITLDDMFIPLRFAPELDPNELNRGAPLPPDDLLGLRRPQVVIGAAGSGKTTWMRWTFRRLIQNPRAIPFLLELRAIAAAWKTPQDAARSVESYLADALSGCGASDPGASVTALLSDDRGPRPTILIDGWDELGSQGEHLRDRLVELCRAFPHVVVVVSSRPYGETRPAGAESFETLYIQPLSDDDIRLLASRFHRCIHGPDELAATRATDELMAALTAAPDARSLAGTVLLLTMMLLLSREGPIPDQRHKLYTAYLRNMLLHRVTQRERDGVAVDLDQQWRPDDGEERLRVVAELAYRLQAEGYERARRAPMVRAWNEAVDLLPIDWTRDQRERFLRWLVASTGVLIDRTDGSVQFAHLSFQEHLAAYYLFISCEGEECIAAVRSRMRDRDWWETLRLWAGLISDRWPDDELSPVLEVLQADPGAYWLAGQMYADGTGRQADFDSWLAELPARLSEPLTWSEDGALAWGASRQASRRVRIATTLASVRESVNWLHGIWHVRWSTLARIEAGPAPALVALEAPIDSAAATARSRVLHGAAASWPDGGELAMLRLWPSIRASVGVRLQTAISLGAQSPAILALLPPMSTRAHRAWSVVDRVQVGAFVGYAVSYLSQIVGRDLGRSFSRDLAMYFGQHYASDYVQVFGRYFDRNFVRNYARYIGQKLEGDFVRGLGSHLGQDFVRDLERFFERDLDPDLAYEFVRDFGHDLDLPEPMLAAAWLPTFAVFEVSSVGGRASPRATLAHGRLPNGAPLLALFRAACRASFAPGDASLRNAAARACEDFDGDPLWPALARHLARISTAEDRALLEVLARHPEKREPPLSWGLQHYVRGDLVLEDDSVVTLDELCARAGLTPPPLLEDMPDELEL